ncbi:hypothetical protein PM038_18115 [Halorubrum ezzemoulense]|uniref:hypothetical protein n=1 Tax=Halorubrum ezzemoulense TaxID=337243 RepID=UPI00232D69A6|nr:hypothetical protein [Halorubrum ezzemoulense]MDB2287134.1 hypothetical protein [Halorubrum ezzemoulense]
MGAEDWDDPHGITTPEFRERYGDSPTLRDALRRAERVASSTPESEQKRCAWCGSTQVYEKQAKSNHSQRHAGDFRCKRYGCRRHFDRPADDTTILMTDERADAFDWVEPSDTIDADERGESPLFATLDERTRTALAIVLYRPWTDAGPSLRELGELFPNSRYWVGERNREWRDGEHRELVPDPTDEPDPITVDESSGATAVATDGGRRRWDAYGS